MAEQSEIKSKEDVQNYMERASEEFAQRIINQIDKAVTQARLVGVHPSLLGNLTTRILALNIGTQEVKLQALHSVAEELRDKVKVLEEKLTSSGLPPK